MTSPVCALPASGRRPRRPLHRSRWGAVRLAPGHEIEIHNSGLTAVRVAADGCVTGSSWRASTLKRSAVGTMTKLIPATSSGWPEH